MAQQADGTVYINTLIDTTGMKPGGKEVEAAVRRMARTVSDMGEKAKVTTQKMVNAFIKQNQAIAQQEKKVQDLEKELDRLSEEKVPTKEYSEATKEVEKLDKALLNAYSRKEKFLETGGKESSRTFKGMEYEIEKLERQLASAEARKEKLESSGGAYQAVDTSGVEQKLVTESQRLQQMNNSLSASYDTLIAKVKQYGGDVSQAMAQASQGTEGEAQSIGILQSTLNGLQAAAHAPVSLIKLLPGELKKFGAAAKSAAKSIGSTFVSGLKKAGSAMLSLHKSTEKSNGSFGSGLKSILKYSLGISGLMSVVSKLRSALKEGFKNLAQYSSTTNASISSLMSALTRLKNSLATAFAPILNVIAPILTKFINMISQAVTYVGMFIAALTGQKTFTKAIGVQEDYAESLSDTASAAQDVADATEEAGKANDDYLSGLDEIRRWESPKEDTGSKGSGNKGGSGGASVGDMFETVPIESSLKNLAEKIKSLIKAEDWEGLGEFIAEGLNKGLAKVKEAISWENVGPAITYFVNAFTRTFNSLVDNLDWNLLGETIGEGVNTIVNTLNLLADGIDWQNLGSKIAVGFNGLFNTVNPENLGKLLSQKIRIAIDTAYGFVTTFDWSNFGTWLGSAINGFFGNIDFAKAGQTLSAGIIGALNGLTAAIAEVDWYGLGQKVKEFLVNIDWAGVCEALFEALGAALGGLALFIWGLIEEAWNSVVEWWYDTAYEDGEFTISGLLEGIWKKIKDIGKWIKEHIFDPFIEGFKKAFGINSPSTVMAEQGGFLMQGLFNGISAWISKIREKFNEIKETILQKWEEVKANTSAKWENIKTTLLTKWNNIKTSVSSVFTSIKTKIFTIWENIVSKIKGSVNSIIGAINGMISGIVSGINSVISALNTIQISIPSWVPTYGGMTFGFNLATISAPQIPYLATGAVIPPNAPFMAVLGDQKRGNNIEAPEALLRKVVREESGNNQGFNGTIRIPVIISGKQVFEAIISEAQLRQMMSGRNPFEMA